MLEVHAFFAPGQFVALARRVHRPVVSMICTGPGPTDYICASDPSPPNCAAKSPKCEFFSGDRPLSANSSGGRSGGCGWENARRSRFFGAPPIGYLGGRGDGPQIHFRPNAPSFPSMQQRGRDAKPGRGPRPGIECVYGRRATYFGWHWQVARGQPPFMSGCAYRWKY
jgi:hypothetical protein